MLHNIIGKNDLALSLQNTMINMALKLISSNEFVLPTLNSVSRDFKVIEGGRKKSESSISRVSILKEICSLNGFSANIPILFFVSLLVLGFVYHLGYLYTSVHSIFLLINIHYRVKLAILSLKTKEMMNRNKKNQARKASHLAG